MPSIPLIQHFPRALHELFAQQQLGWLLTLALEAHDDHQENGPLEALFRSLGDLFDLAERSRQEAIVLAIHPLVSDHRFPSERLPGWAIPTAQGTWNAIRAVMTADIRDVRRIIRHRRRTTETPDV